MLISGPAAGMSRSTKPKSVTKKTSTVTTVESTEKKKKPRTIEGAKAKVRKNQEAIKQSEFVIAELENKITASDEQEYIQEYLYVYRKLKRLVRKAEKNAMTSGKPPDYYAFCTLVSQQREVIADIRSVCDLSGQVQMLLESALQPFVSNIGQVLVNSFYQQRRLIVETTKPEETQFAIKKLDEITNEITKALQIYYEQAAAKINEVLVGAPEEATKKKRKK
jgi:transcription initiation factor TFIIIB Brf1 subunit/transcription initiation factor TFIIB